MLVTRFSVEISGLPKSLSWDLKGLRVWIWFSGIAIEDDPLQIRTLVNVRKRKALFIARVVTKFWLNPSTNWRFFPFSPYAYTFPRGKNILFWWTRRGGPTQVRKNTKQHFLIKPQRSVCLTEKDSQPAENRSPPGKGAKASTKTLSLLARRDMATFPARRPGFRRRR